MPTLEEIRDRMMKDRFAAETGATIETAEPGRAVCALQVEPRHLNANHVPMGGAIFTLADFAFAVAANGFSDTMTVSRSVSMTFLSPAKGERLIAEAKCLKAGRRTSLYEVNVTDELGTYVAHATVDGFAVG